MIRLPLFVALIVLGMTLVDAAAGAIAGAAEGVPILWDAACSGNPLAKGCM